MEPFFTAIPEKSYTTLLFLLFATIGCMLFAILVQTNRLKKIKGAYKQVGFLLSGILALLFFATTLLSIWDNYRIQPIALYQEHLMCYQGKIPYKEIVRAGIYTDKQQSLVNPEIALGKEEMLVIEWKDKPTAIFSAEYYDVAVLVQKINDQMKKGK